VEGRLDQRQRPGRQQRTAHPLQGPRGDQHLRVRRQPAQQGRHREPHHPDDEHLPPPEPVPERPAQQDQPGQRDHVRVDRPLQDGQVRVEVAADARQGDVDDGRVQQRHGGAEDGGEQDPPAPR
jgi:hypothetical protein